MVTADYTHVWDCCCDHGLLGAALLSNYPNSTIHFVDIVPELMEALEHKLHRFYKNAAWKIHCIDVAKLPLDKHKGKHLVIIAGVGGDLMIQFIEAIIQKLLHINSNTGSSTDSSIDFLLCPVHHQFALRQKLIELGFSLKAEILVEDNQRFYEVLHVTYNKNSNEKYNDEKSAVITHNLPGHPVGDNIWVFKTEGQAKVVKKYLNKTLQHYQRIQQGKANDVQYIIDAYNAVTPSMNT